MNPQWLPPNIETARLILRPVTPDDADAVFAACSNPNVTRYTLFDAHRRRDESLAFVCDYAPAGYARQVPDPLAITLKQDPDPRLVGCIGCYWVSESNRTMEAGYWLTEHLWGRGLAAEALAAVVGHVFTEYPVDRIQARVIVGNPASARVLEKVGFRHEGTMRASLVRRGQTEDVMIFALLRAENAG
ncbi:GNAT family N-acetyltransferase [Fimbriiglobus ruber]|uniref:Ribosomal-protein-L7p-serine acetyltransferase n=1 Tax=Fimbriiglobus ruber TaxID=1908690 RepID=A0A225D9N1_9BACT|nr:GNAT family protein [Fimbriiglobus ruber]OWK37683.1 Ribosomal-protein-L7p-serine acetyltransferase [Fimbriiglobus ruber]